MKQTARGERFQKNIGLIAKMRGPILAILCLQLLTGPLAGRERKTRWLTGRVVETGGRVACVRDPPGSREAFCSLRAWGHDYTTYIPTVTVVLLDPVSLRPSAGFVITSDAVLVRPTMVYGELCVSFANQTHLDLNMNDSIKAYKTSKRSLFGETLAVLYEDDKGRERQDHHAILSEIDPDDLKKFDEVKK